MSFDFRLLLVFGLVVNVSEGKSCHKKFEVQPSHSACLDPVSKYKSGGVLTVGDRSTVLNSHNLVRGEVAPAAKDMQKMVWDDELAFVAQGWASQCPNTSEADRNRRRIPGKYLVSQSVDTRFSDVSSLMAAWGLEKTKFVFNGDSNDVTQVGRYTQMIWAKTAKIGCAYAKCDSATIYVCNYAPPGNEGDIGKPYTEGSSCEGCPNNCNSKLCDCGGKVCENTVAIDLMSCSCSCSSLNPFPTDTCSLNCTAMDTDPGSNCGSPNCGANGMAALCPWACNDCPYAGVDALGGAVAVVVVPTLCQLSSLVVLLLCLVMAAF